MILKLVNNVMSQYIQENLIVFVLIIYIKKMYKIMMIEKKYNKRNKVQLMLTVHYK